MKPAAKQPNVIINRYVLGILIALELLMSFSFLGYIHVEPISLTIAYIPVLIAGTLLSPRDSALVAMFFGLASMWKASASYVLPTDQLFSPLLSANPVGSVLLSVGSRILFGLVIGLLYLAVRQLWHPVWGIALVSYVASTIHSFFVYSTMYLFFPQEGFRPIDAVTDFFSPRKLLANAVIVAIMVLLWLAAHTKIWQQVRQRLVLCQTTQEESRYHLLSLVVMAVLTLAAALAVTVYFVHRIDYVLAGLGIDLSNIGYLDVLHLQIQFLLGIVSLMVLVVLFSALSRKYHAALAYEGKVDPLTNAMTRRAFFTLCSKKLSPAGQPAAGYFIMVDLDDFKAINDLYGHPEGDRALREVARCLRETFGKNSLIGRLGGDEFALLLYQDMPRVELEVELNHFLDRVHKITWDDRHMTCSVGVLPIPAGATAEVLYRDADQLLYAAKQAGRDRYVIGDPLPRQAPATGHP